MKDLVKNSVKAAALWFLAGALFALGANLAAPLLGGGVIAGLAAAINPLWLGTMMGGASAIAVAAEPTVNRLFGHKAPEPVSAPAVSEPTNVNISIVHSPQQSQEVAMIDSKFQQNLQEERTVSAEKMLVIS